MRFFFISKHVGEKLFTTSRITTHSVITESQSLITHVFNIYIYILIAKKYFLVGLK